MDRRNFLQGALYASGGLIAASAIGKGSRAHADESSPAAGSNSGGAEPTEVPDTLDLAHHGEHSINGILGTLDPNVDYEGCFWTILDVKQPYMLHWSTMVSGVMPKFVEALPMLRPMTGSKHMLDIEQGFLNAMTQNAEEDGLIYDRKSPKRPWNVGVYYGNKDWDEDYANMAGNGRYLAGLTFMHQATGDDIWRKRADKTAARMMELAIVEGDKAWYPNPGLGNDFSYPRVSGWTTTKPPMDAKEGAEGATMFYLCQPLRGWTRYYLLTGDERYLDLSRKFVNVAILPKFWNALGDMEPHASAERGHFNGHLHGNLAAMRGLLDYALVANDQRVKNMIRDSYDWVRQMGISRLGIVCHGSTGIWAGQMEGCAIGDMTALAVTLTDAGLGDYWDDVESLARNALISGQATDMDELKRVCSEGKDRPPNADWGGAFDNRFTTSHTRMKGQMEGQEVHDNVLERTIGAFCHLSGARYQMPMMMSCCTANGNQGIYFAWEGITRRDGDIATVNMWLNRRSPWLDVWSWLPYEGKLAVQNKGMRQIMVRKPGWARAGQVVCKVDGQTASPAWIGNRMVFSGLRGNELITFDVPVAHDTTQYSLVNVNAPMDPEGVFDCEFRGHTAVSVKQVKARPGSEDRNWYRLFRRDEMKAERAPMKSASAYVHPERIVKWTAL